eukprot:4221058-Amphidinium_carterae.1
MRRSQPKALTAPVKGAGKVVQHHLKGKSSGKSPHPAGGKGQKDVSPNQSAPTGGAALGFPTPP